MWHIQLADEPCHIKAKRMQKFGRGLLQTTFPHIFAAEDMASGGKDGAKMEEVAQDSHYLM